MKKIFLIFTLFIIFNLSSVITKAENYDHPQNELEYFLDSHNKKSSLTYINEMNEEVTLTIEPNGYNLLDRITKGTYKVSKSVKGSWSVSFNITINSNGKITGTSSLNLKALKGSISSTSLTNNATSATCKFNQKIGFITSNVSVIARISNNKIIVN